MDSSIDSEYGDVIAWLTARAADQVEHPGGTLLAHLRRTAQRLRSWGANRALTLAGLCHAGYGTQGFPSALLDLGQREQLRLLVGDDAEAIVYAYCACDRTQLAACGSELRDRFSGEYLSPSVQLRRQLAELTLANELDVVGHAALSADALRAIGKLLGAVSAYTSQAAWSSMLTMPELRAVMPEVPGPTGDPELTYRDLGERGPNILLWHGGASPALTWSRQHGLSEAFSLRIPWRRGCPPSVMSSRQDWELDTLDLLRIMPAQTHVVAHSYGGLSALMAAGVAPERFSSLTIVEAPLWSVALHDAEVQQMAELGSAFARGVPEVREAFLTMAALPLEHEQTAIVERLARNFRDPVEAVPAFARIRAAKLPIAIVSGGYYNAFERLCDAQAEVLDAQRWVLPGAGHAVQRVPAFNDRLRAFVA